MMGKPGRTIRARRGMLKGYQCVAEMQLLRVFCFEVWFGDGKIGTCPRFFPVAKETTGVVLGETVATAASPVFEEAGDVMTQGLCDTMYASCDP